MSKTQEELNALKEEVETLNKKFEEPTEEELAQISGGGIKGTIQQQMLIIELIQFVETNQDQWGCRTKGLSELFRTSDLSFSEIEHYLISNKGYGDSFIDFLFEKYISQGYYQL